MSKRQQATISGSNDGSSDYCRVVLKMDKTQQPSNSGGNCPDKDTLPPDIPTTVQEHLHQWTMGMTSGQWQSVTATNSGAGLPVQASDQHVADVYGLLFYGYVTVSLMRTSAQQSASPQVLHQKAALRPQHLPHAGSVW